ncbi:MAG: hypothetical protein UT29_C0002G0006 [Candidatus Yanofskybacteria bacterium GW2011_GWA1_39_13]|uniref:Uncharacterized protein n=1 Tax=Yanofskybacteria sp. (strain GW2011_GWA1_39_13) TaxID=1619019 RepID=A0A0G0MED5_YANXG|nr:MAG: hypothetical protein UT29_C0002G0006 [Candidatus Yanofskybacteria bacterium GW2011_GWA1_39_13]
MWYFVNLALRPGRLPRLQVCRRKLEHSDGTRGVCLLTATSLRLSRPDGSEVVHFLPQENIGRE